MSYYVVNVICCFYFLFAYYVQTFNSVLYNRLISHVAISLTVKTLNPLSKSAPAISKCFLENFCETLTNLRFHGKLSI